MGGTTTELENHQASRKELQESAAPAPDRPGRALHTGPVTAAAFHGLHGQERSLLPPRGCPPAACVSADVTELFPVGIAPGGRSKGDLERDRRGTAASCWLPGTRRLQCQARRREHDKTRRGTGGTVCEAWCKRWVEALGQGATRASAHQSTWLRKGLLLARVPGEGVFHERHGCAKERERKIGN